MKKASRLQPIQSRPDFFLTSFRKERLLQMQIPKPDDATTNSTNSVGTTPHDTARGVEVVPRVIGIRPP